jgi:hypothetical protein
MLPAAISPMQALLVDSMLLLCVHIFSHSAIRGTPVFHYLREVFIFCCSQWHMVRFKLIGMVFALRRLRNQFSIHSIQVLNAEQSNSEKMVS